MKQIIRMLSLLLAIAIVFGAAAQTAAAEDTGYDDVSSDAWYADAVRHMAETGLMIGTGARSFSPDDPFTRAQLATVLYRMAGEPAVTGEDSFTDTEPGMWYSDAVVWAAQNGVVNGIGGGLFGTNSPATQEQLATMLWRDAGSYVLGEEYANVNGVENDASDWAVNAVRWARVEGLLTDAVEFAPKKEASRAQVADMVHRYLLLKEKFAEVDAVSGATKKSGTDDAEDKDSTGSRVLVAYFSCTNNTARIADYIAEESGGTLYQIIPETPYTSADLNYGDSTSRTTREQNDATARPSISGGVENMEDYDIIFIGYPIWWGQAPKIMYTFIESYDLEDKIIVPFCTSGSSGIGTSATNLKSGTNAAGTWLTGSRFSGSSSRDSVVTWLNGLNLYFTSE